MRSTRGGGLPPPPSDDWLVGQGIALGMIDTVPPSGHFADVRAELRSDGSYAVIVGTAEFGNGTTTVHQQIAATVLGTTIDNIQVLSSDTDHGGHDTGAYGSTGTVVAGRATQLACEALHGQYALSRPSMPAARPRRGRLKPPTRFAPTGASGLVSSQRRRK